MKYFILLSLLFVPLLVLAAKPALVKTAVTLEARVIRLEAKNFSFGKK